LFLLYTFKQRLLTITILLLTGSFANAQLSEKISQLAEQYHENYSAEKIYLQTDKGVYRQGDMIWFKAWCRQNGGESVESASLYIELADNRGKILIKKRYPLTAGQTRGNIPVPEDGKDGIYIIRAYTQWMLNFHPNLLFYRQVAISNTLVPTLRTNKEAADPVTINIFPEGGVLINDAANRIAFSATNRFKLPVDISGTIRDEKGTVITTIQSTYQGMGSFTLRPRAGKRYYMQIPGRDKDIPLPEALNGHGLKLIHTPSNDLQYAITGTTGKPEELLLIAQMNNRICFQKTIETGTADSLGIISTASLSPGILQLSLFNSQGDVLAERYCLVNEMNAGSPLAVSIQSSDKEKRGQQVFTFNTPETGTITYALSVTDNERVPLVPGDNILSGLLLSGYSRGYIHDPAAYFDPATINIKEKADLLMLTQEWQGMQWTSLLQDQLPDILYGKEEGIPIGGQVPLLPINRQRNQVNLVISTDSDSTRDLYNCEVNDQGIFEAGSPSFYDSAYIYYRSNYLNEMEEKKIRFHIAYFDTVTAFEVPKRLLPDSAWRWTKNENAVRVSSIFNPGKNKQMPVVILQSKIKKTESVNDRYTTGPYRNDPFAKTYDLVNNPPDGFTTVAQYLNTKEAGLQTRFDAFGITNLFWRNAACPVFVNELPSNFQFLNTIPIQDVALIKFFKGPFLFGNGAIAVYLKKGGDRGNKDLRGMQRFAKMGYSRADDFFKPNPVRDGILDGYEDNRLTLLWEMNLPEEEKSSTPSIRFYNNDITKQFRLVIEGITAEGKLVSMVKVF
jgi:MG2 domain